LSSAALDKVVREVVEDALTEFRKGLDESGQEALRIIDRIEAEALREAEAIAEAGRRNRESLRQRLLSLAEINARNRSIAVVEESVNAVLQRARERIAQMGGRDLRDSLKSLLLEAIDAIGSKRVVVESNRAGLSVLQKMAGEIEAESNVKVSVSQKPIETAAGVRVRSEDGGVIYDNTVEARLERFRPLLRKEIARLFAAETG